ncbi:UBA/THIF-type NAD/FAD binding protein [Paenibacillus curdlanolyticus YK9]|uniref:UBA/THIF-type NAD/FAD binding protein n=1 Tax=Paenibacillus curdlanolyticus YK9 TaxID=717606 RepID=E0I6A2_9BACL|nr:ThiF family adenylyltransferase [Paenibacillus curdlanolyticus]EFM11568.1 UBA/THIF-type NAD/FAD binding protein [Paenibacillus curdlanolyticus YK9]
MPKEEALPLDTAERYSRQMRFGPIGSAGQTQLGASSVLIVGTGALGASLAQHMARAGVGVVRIADRDFVEPSNLQRQMLFDEEDARSAMPKAVAAAAKLQRINSEITIDAHVADVTAHNVGGLLAGIDLVLDGTDNAASRLVLSDACFQRGIPLIYGGVTASEGMSASLVPGSTACLRCLIGGGSDSEEGDAAADTCDTVGVISPAVEFVAALQAAEALKWLSGNRDAMRGTWVSADVWTFRVREAKLPAARQSCPCCGTQRTAASAAADRGGSAPFAAAAMCGRDSVQVTLGYAISMDRIKADLAQRGCQLTINPYLIRALVPEGQRLVLFPDGRVIVQGTPDVEEAVRLCQAYLARGAYASAGGEQRK